MRLSTGKLSKGLLFVTLTAGSALAQIPGVVQHVQDQMNAVQQQKKAAGDEALNGQATAKAPAGCDLESQPQCKLDFPLVVRKLFLDQARSCFRRFREWARAMPASIEHIGP